VITDFEMSLMQKLIEMKQEFDQLTVLLTNSEDERSLLETKYNVLSADSLLKQGRNIEREHILNLWKTSLHNATVFLERYRDGLPINVSEQK
jgi:hypothetical protein